MELTEEKIIKAKKYNAKLFPIYKMFSWDLLFYYSIIFLFLTQVKGLTASDILFADAFYPLFKLILQIPCVNIVETFGKRKSIILGNLFISLSLISVILIRDISTMILSNLIMAFGYSTKGLCDSTFLNDCIVDKENSRTVFSNIDGRGSAYWYYFDAITSFVCGFLFVFNNYFPIFLCLGCSIISCILAFKLLPYEDSHTKSKLEDETGSFKEYFKDLKIGFKNIFKSNRLKALLLFSGIFAAMLTVRNTIASSLFTEIQIKEEYFGVIFAVLTFISGITSKRQNFFHKRYRNRVLTYFSLISSISMVVIGLAAILGKGIGISLLVILLAYVMQYIIKGPYYTLQKRYLNSFSIPTMSTKIYSSCTFIEGIFSTIVYWICSFLLGLVSTSYAITILGCVFTIIFIFLLDYMKDKIGLKPEEYRKEDITFTEVH